jgi:MFS family permease
VDHQQRRPNHKWAGDHLDDSTSIGFYGNRQALRGRRPDRQHFFAGYMLTQFPGGYVGDRYGHRTVIVISLFWAAVATLISGLASVQVAFIAVRIFTGLGEGIYYANDRAVFADTTPLAERSLAMGVVITGLSIGITLATAGAPAAIDLGAIILGEAEAWRMPFFALCAISLLTAWLVVVRPVGNAHAAGQARPSARGASAVLGRVLCTYFRRFPVGPCAYAARMGADDR